MASATLNISITITDTPNHPLATVRDELLIALNYLGGGGINWVPTGTAQDKLNFFQAILAKEGRQFLKNTYLQKLQMNIISADVDIQ